MAWEGRTVKMFFKVESFDDIAVMDGSGPGQMPYTRLHSIP